VLTVLNGVTEIIADDWPNLTHTHIEIPAEGEKWYWADKIMTPYYMNIQIRNAMCGPDLTFVSVSGV
jgi:hypothetical protein